MTDHYVHTTYGDGMAHWECSCGRAGTCSEDRVDIKSDEHIDYLVGDHRIETSREW